MVHPWSASVGETTENLLSVWREMCISSQGLFQLYESASDDIVKVTGMQLKS